MLIAIAPITPHSPPTDKTVPSDVQHENIGHDPEDLQRTNGAFKKPWLSKEFIDKIPEKFTERLIETLVAAITTGIVGK